MKTIAIATIWIMFLTGGIARTIYDDNKSDAELLEFARNRAIQERVTADPIRIDILTVLLCKRPSPEQQQKDASDPHLRAAIHVYASETAVAPLWDPYEKFPVGSILLKEKFDVEKMDTPTLYTGMIKREAGYFPDCGDWEFFTLDGAITQVTSRGKTESCAACHRDFAKADFVSKQYAALPADHRAAFVDGQWRSIESITAGSSNVFYLPASLAETHGTTLRYEPDERKNTLGYWANVDDWASWKIDVRKPATFQVSVLQGCGIDSGGAEVAVSLADQTLTFVVEDTGHFQNFKWRDIGQVEITAPGEYTLTVKPRTKPGVAVMDLRQIILLPTSENSEK